MVSTAVTKGNTVLPPVRLTGEPRADLAALAKGLNDFYLRFAVDVNVIGDIQDLQSRMTKVEADIAAIKTFLEIP